MECFLGLFDIDPPAVIHLESKDAYEKKGVDLSCICDGAVVRYDCRLVFAQAADIDSACVSSIIRLVYSVQMAHVADTSYIIGKVAMWRYDPEHPLFFHRLPANLLEVAPKLPRSSSRAPCPSFPTSSNLCSRRFTSSNIPPVTVNLSTAGIVLQPITPPNTAAKVPQLHGLIMTMQHGSSTTAIFPSRRPMPLTLRQQRPRLRADTGKIK